MEEDNAAERLHSFLHGLSAGTVVTHLSLRSMYDDKLNLDHFTVLTDALLSFFSKFPDHLPSLEWLDLGCLEEDFCYCLWEDDENGHGEDGDGYKALSRFEEELKHKRPRNLKRLVIDTGSYYENHLFI